MHQALAEEVLAFVAFHSNQKPNEQTFFFWELPQYVHFLLFTPKSRGSHGCFCRVVGLLLLLRVVWWGRKGGLFKEQMHVSPRKHALVHAKSLVYCRFPHARFVAQLTLSCVAKYVRGWACVGCCCCDETLQRAVLPFAALPPSKHPMGDALCPANPTALMYMGDINTVVVRAWFVPNCTQKHSCGRLGRAFACTLLDSHWESRTRTLLDYSTELLLSFGVSGCVSNEAP